MLVPVYCSYRNNSLTVFMFYVLTWHESLLVLLLFSQQLLDKVYVHVLIFLVGTCITPISQQQFDIVYVLCINISWDYVFQIFSAKRFLTKEYKGQETTKVTRFIFHKIKHKHFTTREYKGQKITKYCPNITG